MSTKIYRYVVQYDGGSAPNPCDGYCSLAICKPAIRRTAKIGDWLIGLRSGMNDHLIYAMKVEEILPLGNFWEDRRFKSRRPDFSLLSDNIYRPDGAGSLNQVHNYVHDDGNVLRDRSGKNVLLSERYWYFGRKSPPLPPCLKHLIHRGVGYAVHINRQPSDVQRLEHWLLGWDIGVHGSPVQLRDDANFSVKNGVASVSGPQRLGDGRKSLPRC